jgi:preprotein translocase subunit SecD
LNLNDSIINNHTISNIGLIKLSDTAEFDKIIKDLKFYMPKDCLFAYQQSQTLQNESALAVFALRNNTWKLPFTDMIDSVTTVKAWSGQPALSIQFNKLGSKKFEAITVKNVGKPIAIVIDGIVYSAPFVNGPIEGGRAEISGNFTSIEANQLTTMISGGYLPIRLSFIK